MRPAHLAAVGVALASSLLAVTSATAHRVADTACSPAILKSPRAGSKEVQAKALNDRGDVVGFSDGADGTFRAILWPGGKVAGAVNLGVAPGYVSSEAYGVNNDRVVYGVLYDQQERTFPFRWKKGRMTLLRDPGGRVRQVSLHDPTKNALNDRGESAATLRVGRNIRAVRWARDGKATFLPALPGHTWTWADTINNDGVVSGWSRKRPRDGDVESPVIWTRSGNVVGLKAPRGRDDGFANASNTAGLIVGVLGTGAGVESDQAAVWRTRTSKPQLFGPATPYAYGELVDVNERGQAAGSAGTFTRKGFPRARGVIWRPGWDRLRTIPVPAAARVNPVLVTGLDDINNRGAIVGNVYGLSAPDFSKLRRIDPVLWTCRWPA